VTKEEAGFANLISAVRQQAGTADFDLAIILGSGLGGFADAVTNPAIFNYRDFSCFPPVSVPGHAGCLFAGRLLDWRVLLFAGRLHLYEGCTAFQTTLPVRLAGELGCRRLLLTNAAGGVRDEFAPGDFMFIADHLNLLGDNPLRTLPDSFVNLSRLYRCDFFSPLQEWAGQERIPLHRGVLAALSGPSYETPAEIRMLRILGADAVSMSTIPEALMGRYLGMDVVGLSLIANKAAGLACTLSHAEVLDVAQRSAPSFNSLVRQLISIWQTVE
jgi:purine-nucleoside phosphorylase